MGSRLRLRLVGNQLPILLIDFQSTTAPAFSGWESVTDPLDRLLYPALELSFEVGNQLPILLIDFQCFNVEFHASWESVTDPLDRLQRTRNLLKLTLGISYRSS